MIMTTERASEILAAYGADAARWPADERVQCAALIARDPGLAAEHARAAKLDGALAAWSRAPVVADADRAIARAVVGLPAAANVWRNWRPLIGGALAASVAAVLYFAPGGGVTTPPTAAQPSVAINQRQADSELFRATFTPTPDEEDIL